MSGVWDLGGKLAFGYARSVSLIGMLRQPSDGERDSEVRALGEGTYGVISKAVPKWYLPKDCVVPNRLPLLSIITPKGYSPSAAVNLWTTLYVHLPPACGDSLKTTPQ